MPAALVCFREPRPDSYADERAGHAVVVGVGTISEITRSSDQRPQPTAPLTDLVLRHVVSAVRDPVGHPRDGQVLGDEDWPQLGKACRGSAVNDDHGGLAGDPDLAAVGTSRSCQQAHGHEDEAGGGDEASEHEGYLSTGTGEPGKADSAADPIPTGDRPRGGEVDPCGHWKLGAPDGGKGDSAGRTTSE